MGLILTLSTIVSEDSTPQITGTFQDEAGTATQPDACTLTVWDEDSNRVISDAIDITSSISSGALAYRVLAAHTAILNDARTEERKHFLFEYTVSSVVNKTEVVLRVRNVRHET